MTSEIMVMTMLNTWSHRCRNFRGVARRLCIVLVALANAQAMHAAAPDELTILMIDDHDIMYGAGTQRVFHPAVRFPGNPVIAEDKPWETTIAWNSVYRDAKTGRYQMWYQAHAHAATTDKAFHSAVCYAESADGITWTKPNLGLFEFNGSRKTNHVLLRSGGYGDRYCNSVLVVPDEKDPARRYKMLYYEFAQGEGEQGSPGGHVAFSPDGIHWTKLPGGPVYRTGYGARGQQPPFAGESGYSETPVPAKNQVRRSWAVPLSMSDACDVIFDPRLKKYVAYGKCWIAAPDGGLSFKHAMGRIESDDFLHWSAPQIVSTPDDLDAPNLEYHTSPVFYYSGVYFCLNQILAPREPTDDRSKFMIDIELMISRDGIHWKRPFRGKSFLEPETSQFFSQGSTFTNATPILLGDEMRFYYGGYSNTAIGGGASVTGPEQKSGVGFATLRRDRFAGIRPLPVSDQVTLKKPVENIGQVTLKPLDFTGRVELSVNADASKGTIKAEILDEDGYRMPGFTADDADALTGDSLNHCATWRGKKSIAGLPRGRYLIRLHLQNAEVFAITLR